METDTTTNIVTIHQLIEAAEAARILLTSTSVTAGPHKNSYVSLRMMQIKPGERFEKHLFTFLLPYYFLSESRSSFPT